MKTNELIATYWTYKWAESNGIPKEDAEKALQLKEELFETTELNEDEIEALVVCLYKKNKTPIERFFEACEKSKGSGKIVRVCRYEPK